MTSEDQHTGLVWALIQEWMDAIPYPPSQRKLAARIDVSPSAVSDWKYRRGFPEPAALKRLANEIGVPYERVLNAVLIDRGYRDLPKELMGNAEHPAPKIELTKSQVTKAARNTRRPTAAERAAAQEAMHAAQERRRLRGDESPDEEQGSA